MQKNFKNKKIVHKSVAGQGFTEENPDFFLTLPKNLLKVRCFIPDNLGFLKKILTFQVIETCHGNPENV